VEWRVRAIRGATTVADNTVEAIREAVLDLLAAIESHNAFDPEEVVSVIFTATPDLDAIFPAAIARERPHWANIPLLDVQQMQVQGSLPHCIRILIQVNTPHTQKDIAHLYLRGAQNLRPDLAPCPDPAYLE
jgi:chorismate mutase